MPISSWVRPISPLKEVESLGTELIIIFRRKRPWRLWSTLDHWLLCTVISSKVPIGSSHSEGTLNRSVGWRLAQRTVTSACQVYWLKCFQLVNCKADVSGIVFMVIWRHHKLSERAKPSEANPRNKHFCEWQFFHEKWNL